jgi:hypothetical protein
MFETLINFEVAEWSGSPVLRHDNKSYSRRKADDYKDKPARLTDRQMVFYVNLMRMARALDSSTLPVDFTHANGNRMFMDHGCIKIAVHAGFLRPLVDDASGIVSTVELAWRVDGVSVLC